MVPLTDGTIAYVPAGLKAVADVENVSVKVSPFTAPLSVPANAGFAVPYTRDPLFALMLSGAWLTFNKTLLVEI